MKQRRFALIFNQIFNPHTEREAQTFTRNEEILCTVYEFADADDDGDDVDDEPTLGTMKMACTQF